MKFVLLQVLLPSLLFSVYADAQVMFVLLLDSSSSMARWRQLMRLESADALYALPHGQPFQVIAFGDEPRPIAAGFATSNTVNNAIERIQQLKLRSQRTDMGAALQLVSRTLQTQGVATSVLTAITDCDVDPANGSAFVGRSLKNLLEDPALVPAGMRLLIRCYESRYAPRPSRTGVSVLTLPHHLGTALRSTVLPLPEVGNQPLIPRSFVYRVILAVALIVAIGVVTILRAMRRNHLAQEQHVDATLISAARSPSIVTTALVRSGPLEAVLSDDRNLITLGPVSRLFRLRDAPATVELRLEGGRVLARNLGPHSIRVGRLSLPSGGEIAVPDPIAELRIGTRTVTVLTRKIRKIPTTITAKETKNAHAN